MKNLSVHTKIGVWGFGRVGKATVKHLHSLGYQVTVLDNRILRPEEKEILDRLNIPLLGQHDSADFLNHNDVIIPSPGIDLRPYTTYANKWLSELDLFAHSWRKPYIAITGTVGKTTVTHVLGQLIQKSGMSVAVGGNIGIAMLDLLAQQDTVDLAILEVSSFQLELATQFSPDLALWTNFYANHLDRHSSAQEYFDAKAMLLRHQRAGQHAIVPLELAAQLGARSWSDNQPQQQIHFFSSTPPATHELTLLPVNSSIFFLDHDTIFYQPSGLQAQKIAHLSPTLYEITFAQNWLLLCAALHLRGISCDRLNTWASSITLPAHRLEKIATIQGIDFYNDSKATTPQSTLAAVQRLHERPIILFLGGLSKGIDRTDFIKLLPKEIKMVFCFGKEAPHLGSLCRNYALPAQEYATLEQAFAKALAIAQPGDQLLFSPAGSSFDLFANYEARGTYFKHLVENYKNS
jgi:UDP-N-acetylmuramoylalanine--D-glutamate ligase